MAHLNVATLFRKIVHKIVCSFDQKLNSFHFLVDKNLTVCVKNVELFEKSDCS